MLTNKNEIKCWLDKMNIKSYTIRDDLTVDVDHHVNLSKQNLKSIAVQFNQVNGDFSCQNNQLSSLLGVPKCVLGLFACHNNLLHSYQHVPEYIGNSFFCSDKIDITELHSMRIKHNFIHYCKQPHDKIEAFSHSYNIIPTIIHQYHIEVDGYELRDAIELEQVLKEKKALENSLCHGTKLANQVKL